MGPSCRRHERHDELPALRVVADVRPHGATVSPREREPEPLAGWRMVVASRLHVGLEDGRTEMRGQPGTVVPHSHFDGSVRVGEVDANGRSPVSRGVVQDFDKRPRGVNGIPHRHELVAVRHLDRNLASHARHRHRASDGPFECERTQGRNRMSGQIFQIGNPGDRSDQARSVALQRPCVLRHLGVVECLRSTLYQVDEPDDRREGRSEVVTHEG